uniref:Uncharacterized protein n=1 Tax=Vespula pensylvanica TaxID=30213 RepID=A0A834NFG8_VESPE|nr:hypothetical protein H0235_014701 [Vespula pensylvanica]
MEGRSRGCNYTFVSFRRRRRGGGDGGGGDGGDGGGGGGDREEDEFLAGHAKSISRFIINFLVGSVMDSLVHRRTTEKNISSSRMHIDESHSDPPRRHPALFFPADSQMLDNDNTVMVLWGCRVKLEPDHVDRLPRPNGVIPKQETEVTREVGELSFAIVISLLQYLLAKETLSARVYPPLGF